MKAAPECPGLCGELGPGAQAGVMVTANCGRRGGRGVRAARRQAVAEARTAGPRHPSGLQLPGSSACSGGGFCQQDCLPRGTGWDCDSRGNSLPMGLPGGRGFLTRSQRAESPRLEDGTLWSVAARAGELRPGEGPGDSGEVSSSGLWDLKRPRRTLRCCVKRVAGHAVAGSLLPGL